MGMCSAALVLSLLWLVVAGHDVGMVFEKQPAKKLSGCTLRTIPNVNMLLICSQLCNKEVLDCRSFNWFPTTSTCELNFCNHGDLLIGSVASVSLQSDADSSYYQMKFMDGECNVNTGNQESTCHPVGTKWCTPSSLSANGSYTARVCNCHEFASGSDCSQVNECTTEGMCLSYKTSATNHDSAKSTCASLKGHLLTVNSPSDHKYVTMFMERYYPSQDIHIGLKYYANYDDFAYSNNMQPLSGYSNWLEVKAASSRAACVKLSASNDYKWVDVDCSASLPYICMIPTCPSGFQQFNGSCYYYDSAGRYWTRNIDQCANRGADLAWVTYPQEESYINGQLQSLFGTGYPVSHGLHRYYISNNFMWSHNSWIIFDFADKTDYLGCYKDCSGRTMASLEGSTGLLNDNAQARSDPITKCYYVARWHNYQVFSVQNGGECRADANAHLNYDSQGVGSGCVGGEGAACLTDNYEIKDHNLYMNMAFDSGWNGGDYIYGWWHGDSWRWHDYGSTSTQRSVCKIEHCPQGFIPFQNKCLKIVDKQLSRDAARDECQRFTGADLFNPEYSDELTYLSDVIADSGLSGYFWVGIQDENVNGDRQYQVMKKPVENNYDAFILGAEPMWRYNQDGVSLLTTVEMRWTFPADGYVTAWEYYSGTAGRDLRFAVFRRQANTEPSECKYTAVGFNYFTSVSGYKREDIGQNHRIRVKQGDHIGLISPSGASIRFDHEASGLNTCYSHSIYPTQVNEMFTLSPNFDRVYAYRAVWVPDGLESGTPFDLGNPHVFDGYRCFIADSAADMKVRDYGCNTDVPFICEIKKKHRFNP